MDTQERSDKQIINTPTQLNQPGFYVDSENGVWLYYKKGKAEFLNEDGDWEKWIGNHTNLRTWIDPAFGGTFIGM